MNAKTLCKVSGVCLVVFLVLCGVALGYVRWKIQSDLDVWCVRAQESHSQPGDDVAALIAYVQSDLHNLQDRDLAVWALGQARDERALSVLQAFVTGEECNHNEALCQYELKEAIELSESDAVNILGIRTPVAPNYVAPAR